MFAPKVSGAEPPSSIPAPTPPSNAAPESKGRLSCQKTLERENQKFCAGRYSSAAPGAEYRKGLPLPSAPLIRTCSVPACCLSTIPRRPTVLIAGIKSTKKLNTHAVKMNAIAHSTTAPTLGTPWKVQPTKTAARQTVRQMGGISWVQKEWDE